MVTFSLSNWINLYYLISQKISCSQSNFRKFNRNLLLTLLLLILVGVQVFSYHGLCGRNIYLKNKLNFYMWIELIYFNQCGKNIPKFFVLIYIVRIKVSDLYYRLGLHTIQGRSSPYFRHTEQKCFLFWNSMKAKYLYSEICILFKFTHV